MNRDQINGNWEQALGQVESEGDQIASLADGLLLPHRSQNRFGAIPETTENRTKWGKIADEDSTCVESERERLAAKLKEREDVTREGAERKIDEM